MRGGTEGIKGREGRGGTEINNREGRVREGGREGNVWKVGGKDGKRGK